MPTGASPRSARPTDEKSKSRVMSVGAPLDRLDALSVVFHAIDEDGNGFLEKGEIKAVRRQITDCEVPKLLAGQAIQESRGQVSPWW